MPKYGRHKYGSIRYGKFEFTSGSAQSIGPHVRYRVRGIDKEGNTSPVFVTMCEDRASVPKEGVRIRMRSEDEEWVYTQNESIKGEVLSVRIRSLSPDGGKSEWVQTAAARIRTKE